MVNPLYLVAVYLIGAFLLALTDKINRQLSVALMLLTLLYAVEASLIRLWGTLAHPEMMNQVFTAGFSAPLSIVLKFGLEEALLLSIINAGGFLGAVYLFKRFAKEPVQAMSLYLLVMLGANGLIMTRDIFNTFVFLEILSIATYALLAIKENKNTLAAGLKYMLASGLASSFLLIGIIFAYRYTGTLNIDTWVGLKIASSPGYFLALFLIICAVLIELKPFPANGWALDLYQSVHSGVGAIIASINTGALLFLFYKLLPLCTSTLLYLFGGAGLFSFVMANLVALRQKDAKRLLGYSSTAQSGLIIFVMAGMTVLGLPNHDMLIIALGLFLTNFLSKSGLFWLSGIVKQDELKNWRYLRKNTGLLITFTIFILALVGFPPFPSFFSKWQLVNMLASSHAWLWMGFLLLGSLLEAIYLLRWLGMVFKNEESEIQADKLSVHKAIPFIGSLLLLILSSVNFAYKGFHLPPIALFPVVAMYLFWVIDFLPVKLKGVLAIAGLLAWGWFVMWGRLSGLEQLFCLMLIGGSTIQIFTFLRHKGKQSGLMPMLVLLILSMGNILMAKSNLEFFMSWELMTVASYLLIIRGIHAKEPALSFITFSLGGAYLLLAGLAMFPSLLSYQANMTSDAVFSGISVAAIILFGMGLLIKLGALGVHVWLPDSYAEADDEFTVILSSVLSKAGVFGLVLLLSTMVSLLPRTALYYVLGWIGALTAFFGALMAVFQEDIKKLVAYSSMSQVGYIVLSLAMMTHIGWVSGLYQAVNHFLFKGLIFTAVAVVIMKTGTRNMYEMGGLIKKLPIAYISVLMGIIAASGVPPLTGFGAKWFLYSALIERGWYLQAGLAFFASAVAFLYLYRLIHTVFLGQLKPAHANVKEAPFWMIIPQGVFIMLIMAFSMFPNLLTKPLSEIVEGIIAKPDWLTWQGYNILLSSPNLHGYWNGNLVMMVTMGVFGFPLVWLLLVNARVQKVKQFNIVFAAERPYKPWTTHFAHNMFAHYNKALGWLISPRITTFWQETVEWTHSISSTLSRIYTGNGQTYLLHVLLYVLTLYFIAGVK